MGQLFRAAAPIVAVVFLAQMPGAGQVRPAATKDWSVPRTADNHPDLQGIWTNATVTPLERPAELTGKAFFTSEEAADYEKRARERNNGDRRDVNSDADLAVGYNDFWW